MRRAAAVGLCIALLTAPAVARAPHPDDRALPRTIASDNGLFRVTVTSERIPVPLNLIHAWRVTVDRPDGTPVRGAQIALTGQMPEVPRDLPTEPQVTQRLPGGVYVIDGVRFNMAGRWRLKLTVQTGTYRDNAAFDIKVGDSVP